MYVCMYVQSKKEWCNPLILAGFLAKNSNDKELLQLIWLCFSYSIYLLGYSTATHRGEVIVTLAHLAGLSLSRTAPRCMFITTWVLWTTISLLWRARWLCPSPSLGGLGLDWLSDRILWLFEVFPLTLSACMDQVAFICKNKSKSFLHGTQYSSNFARTEPCTCQTRLLCTWVRPHPPSYTGQMAGENVSSFRPHCLQASTQSGRKFFHIEGTQTHENSLLLPCNILSNQRWNHASFIVSSNCLRDGTFVSSHKILQTLPPEALKALDEHNIGIITSLCNIIYNSGMIPTEMKHPVFVALPKKPKAMNCTEFRTISLMSHVTKLLLKIIQQRMANKIDKEVSRLQSGFRPGTSTREGIFNLRTICERATDVQKNVYICFIYYTKAFNRVKHLKMIECLSELGMDDKDLQIQTNCIGNSQRL